MSRRMSHLPSCLRHTSMYLPVPTVLPAVSFTAKVPECQPRLPETPVVLSPISKVVPAEVAMSVVKKARNASPFAAAGTPGGITMASSA